jgi:G3E family GTPase
VDYGALIPVNVVTGFLGSGKTTLLQRLLKSPLLRDTAVLVNEFGEIGLDHHLLQNLTENTVLLDNGCLCCAMRGDVQDALRQLFSQTERGEIPAFRRVVIETSGLADPVPIAYTVLAEPVLQHHFRLGNTITAVDAVNGLEQLGEFEESVKQAAVADRLILTKSDIAAPEEVAKLRAALQEINHAAPILDAAADDLSPQQLLVEDIHDAAGKAREVGHWLAAAAQSGTAQRHHHTGGVSSFALTFEQALDWTAFGIWMTMLLNRHGERVLRIKGMLNVSGVETPVLINGVQHIVHPPVHLEAWPDQDRHSRLVFIVRGIERQRIEASLAAFMAL